MFWCAHLSSTPSSFEPLRTPFIFLTPVDLPQAYKILGTEQTAF